MKNLSILSILLLTLSLNACEIRSCTTTDTHTDASTYQDEPCENTEANDENDQHDANEPPNGTPAETGEPTTYCPSAAPCDGSGDFQCGAYEGFYLDDGGVFLCEVGGECFLYENAAGVLELCGQ